METSVAVKDGDVELLLKSLKQKHERELIAAQKREEKRVLQEETNINSALNTKRKNEFLLTIASVYYFLRCTLDLARIELSLNEFEVAEAELKKVGAQEKKKIIRKLFRFLSRKNTYIHFLDHGHLPFKKLKPRFGKPKKHWWKSHPWYNENECPTADKFNETWFAIPPNHAELLNQLFQKRYPNAQAPEK